jgi:hypothetical protein
MEKRTAPIKGYRGATRTKGRMKRILLKVIMMGTLTK